MRKLKIILKKILLLPFQLFSNVSFFALVEESHVHRTSVVRSGCRLYYSEVGKYTYIADNCTITHTKIGAFCSIADFVMINPGNHPIQNVSTSPLFYSENNPLKKCFNRSDYKEYDDSTIIGNDVWIGTHAFVKGGLTIGDGAVIGAYAVVTKNIEPYSVVAGNPARVIKKRFDDNTIKKLLESGWWEFDDDKLHREASSFTDVGKFIESLEK